MQEEYLEKNFYIREKYILKNLTQLTKTNTQVNNDKVRSNFDVNDGTNTTTINTKKI